MNTHDHHDDETLPGEDELRKLYRGLPAREPTSAMDQAVRRAAAAAVQPTRRRMPRWPVAAASAAVLVIAAGLGWRLRDASPALQPPASVTQARNERAAPAMPASPQAKTPLPPMLDTQAPQASYSSVPKSHAPEPAVRAAAPRRAPPPVELAAAPVVAAPPPPAPVSVGAQEASQASNAGAVAADHVAPLAEARAMMKTTSAAMASRTMAAPAPMQASVDPTAANATDTPAQELEKIRQLFAQQRHDEARQRLQAFRQAHPDFALPDDLRAQLPDHE